MIYLIWNIHCSRMYSLNVYNKFDQRNKMAHMCLGIHAATLTPVKNCGATLERHRSTRLLSLPEGGQRVCSYRVDKTMGNNPTALFLSDRVLNFPKCVFCCIVKQNQNAGLHFSLARILGTIYVFLSFIFSCARALDS